MKRFGIVWWKWLAVVLVLYTIIGGFFVPVPRLEILYESIRNLFFHVPMWFGMTLLLAGAVGYSIAYLVNGNLKHDVFAAACVKVALLMGLAGLVTGMQWARTTWGAWWVNDPKLLGAAVGLLLYFAYFILRGSLTDLDQRARVSAVANVMFFAIYIPAIYVVPRLTESLHPGNGGNPGFSSYDLDRNMRWVFYPAVLGWTLLGAWIVSIVGRIRLMELQLAGGAAVFQTSTRPAQRASA